MLDRVHSCAHRRLNPFRTLSVRHHFLPGTMSDLDRLGHLFFAQLLNAEVTEYVAHASGGHQLDPIGAVFQVAPHRWTYFFHVVGNIWPACKSLVRRQEVDVSVTSRDRYEISGRNYARSANQTTIDAVPQSQLSVSSVIFPSVPQRRESFVEPDLYVVDSP